MGRVLTLSDGEVCMLSYAPMKVEVLSQDYAGGVSNMRG